MNAWKRIIQLVVAVLLLAAPVDAVLAQVKVTAATPATAYQGTVSLDVVVTGSGFDRSAKAQYFVSGTTNPGGISVRGVTYRSSTELVTTIDVASSANLSNFDIQVTLESGRKGKGTTLFSVKAKPNDPNSPPSTPPPTSYPVARAWHAFTSNGGATVATNRLYMYGGAGADWQVVPEYFWYYRASDDAWTIVTPASTATPGPRQHNGLSCGAGACVVTGGSNGIGLVSETWAYSEATNAWSPAACDRRNPCPSPRQMPAIAFDAQRGYHLLFGGRGSVGYNDTYTFDVATRKWMLRAPSLKPSERNRASAAHVPGVGIVMHGGQNFAGSAALCDMYAWDGANWNRIGYDTSQPYPCLHSHDAAWDGQGLVFRGGYVNTSDTPSSKAWRFTFGADGRSGTWSTLLPGTCQPVLGTDAVIHPGARSAYDASTRTWVSFGGEQNTSSGVVRYDNTVECY
jgi:hypothetical protein